MAHFIELPMTANQLEAEILKLPRPVRAHLATLLLESLDDVLEPEAEVEAAWSKEADRRYAAFLKGENAAEPLGPLLERLRTEFGV